MSEASDQLIRVSRFDPNSEFVRNLQADILACAITYAGFQYEYEENESMEIFELDELWVAIPGYPNYKVSSMGTVLNIKTEREVKATPTKAGYFKVKLYNKGLRQDFYVHRLVAQAFFLDYCDGVEVKHINEENRHDNTVLNLKLGTGCRKAST